MSIITEEMRYSQKLCEYAKKYGVTKAARRYHTNHQFVYRQLKKYDGTVRIIGKNLDILMTTVLILTTITIHI